MKKEVCGEKDWDSNQNNERESRGQRPDGTR